MDVKSILKRYSVQALIIALSIAAFVGLVVTFHSSGVTYTIEEVNVEPMVSGNGGSLVMTCNATPAVGDVILASIISFSSSGLPYVSSVSQANVAWTEIINGSYQMSSDQYFGNCIWEGIVSSSPGKSVAISFGNSNGMCSADAMEFSGVSNNASADQIATSSGLSAAITTGTTSALSQSNELCIGSIACQTSVTNPTNSYILIDGSLQGPLSNSLFYLISTSTNGQSTGATVSSTYYSGLIATFFAKGENAS